MRLNCYGGPTTSNTRVKFSKPYATPPRVVCTLGLVDWCNYGNNLRVNSYPLDVSTDGFTAVLTTWADTSMYSATIRWSAFYSSSPGDADGLDLVNNPNVNSNTWAEMNQFCSDKGKRLCNSKEMCPGNIPITNMNIFGGVDNWMAVSDRQNEWVTYATFENRLCKTHTEVAGGTPGWGTSKNGGNWYRAAKCCAK